MGASILVVEDEAAIQEMIALNLNQAGHEPLLAANAQEALDQVRESLPDLMLVDWMLPGLSGVDLVRRLRASERTQNIPIIMLTARAEEADKLMGLESGADDYITKPFSIRELNARIKAVLRRRAPQMTEDPVRFKDLLLDPGTHRVSIQGEEIGLGPTEFKLLHFFMTHPERVYSRTQILDHVWGDHVFIEERTVDVHIRRLRAALEPSGSDEILQTVRGSGYRLTALP
ncbi:MAG: phosphate regulon transcriptional regulator PhoB [Betaproteobacteria bacterium]|nr:phosphate regulon transcriptional regulator PhoB [Betaproteobacteria bacterium]MDE1980870.1 phosphate regulon transcriptional regulator PhoB [Betaproteobacteria bacterium]MDE2131418.1 phosphate regulon transcriptional regulator PhoB [Betaproteobacteria bacterium]MDE2211273.1 phosphate regulon transcriptional regulator PhoB [Betaproteobacteria bacterium]MDE2354722.1 phosphate regulon transcriptional regulator PhoB [Betaproteobacteria bacterium]